MTIDRGLLDRIKARGEEVLTQVSAELTSNPRFMKAVEGALRGKDKVEAAVGRALKQMNLPSRTELKRALARIDTLEREVASLKAKTKSRPAARRASRGKSTRQPAQRKPSPFAASGWSQRGHASRSMSSVDVFIESSVTRRLPRLRQCAACRRRLAIAHSARGQLLQ